MRDPVCKIGSNVLQKKEEKIQRRLRPKWGKRI
jgi:hypothetical protein